MNLRLATALAATMLSAGCHKMSPPTTSCIGCTSFVLVDTTAHRLSLCDGPTLHHFYNVRLGRGGVGKTEEGDGKVPLGRYELGPPRPSSRFGTFIPIHYPTSEQKARGYTGSDVGVHGPNRDLIWLGKSINTFDTTEGCVGLALDTEIVDIAAWVTRRRASTIFIK
jgi:murein L,D-transpeptidase YafK